MTPVRLKEGLHPRNRFRAGYDFPRLIARSPALAPFVARLGHGAASIDFANPAAVKALNRALLRDGYGIETWDIPPGYLCPAIPGRSDYLHHVADLLAQGEEASIPRGRTVAVLDIGVGASCIYPLIGVCEYGWRFVGAEVDPVALRWARKLVASNRAVADLIECRFQPMPRECFAGVVQAGERFALTICNPPFHASAAEAAAATRRKLRNLSGKTSAAVVRNFGGTPRELWCEGGEPAFVQRMIRQSADMADRCLWFTALIAKRMHLPRLQRTLREVNAAEVKVIAMAHGQKSSRILAWTFCTTAARQAWRESWRPGAR